MNMQPNFAINPNSPISPKVNSAQPFHRFNTGASIQGQGGPQPPIALPWSPPLSLDNLLQSEFPVNCLPAGVREFVEAVALNTQTPPEMAGIFALGVLASILQRKYTVVITDDWSEVLCLYVVAVAAPGERKSPVLNAMTAPLRNYEERVNANIEPSAPEYRLLVDDITPEKLVEVMAAQGGAITLASTESDVFDSIMGRYTKNPNMSPYLKAHDGDSITVDRITRSRDSVPHPRLTMILAAQPSIFQEMMSNPKFQGRGLCARFLFANCMSKVGQRNVAPPTIPAHVKANYSSLINRLLECPWNGAITLSPDAQNLRIQYAQKIEDIWLPKMPVWSNS